VHAVRLLRFAHTVIASELPPDTLGSKHRPVGVAQALAVVGQADRATPIPTAANATLNRAPVELTDTITALIADEPTALPAEAALRTFSRRPRMFCPHDWLTTNESSPGRPTIR
jgi:hypothetical protein